MAKYKLSNEYISECNEITAPVFPKYSTQIINLANQNAGGTRPRIVGQLSELFPEYLEETTDVSIEHWKKWYLKKYPDAIDTAVERIYCQLENLKNSIVQIDKNMIRIWVEDLIFNKTYNGMYVQKAVLKKISEIENKPYRLASASEEAKNIDGFVGDIPYQIKPETYNIMKREVHETVNCKIVIYRKTSTGYEIEY